MAAKSLGLRWIAAILGIAALACGAAAAAALWWLDHPLSVATASAELSIEPGTSPKDIAQAWVSAGVRADAGLL